MTLSWERVLLSNELTFPVDVTVVKGMSTQKGLSINSGSRLRILLIATETVFRCQTELGGRNISISLSCPNKLELLQPDPALDDQTYETARDILQAPIRPCWVCVQQGYAGKTSRDTIETCTILEDLRLGRAGQGEACLCATVVQADQRQQPGESVFLSLDTVGKFTTRDSARYLAIELVEKWISTKVPQRVQVHGSTGGAFKACILKLEEQKVAVCINLESWQYMVIPSSPEILVCDKKEYPTSSRLSLGLHRWINFSITAFPRIESFSVEDQFHSNVIFPSVDYLAVLFSPTHHNHSMDSDYLCDYKTLLQHSQMFGMSSGPIHHIGPLFQSNLLARHRNLCKDLSILLDKRKDEDCAGSDDDYECLGYEKVDSIRDTNYAGLQIAPGTVQTEHVYWKLNVDMKTMSSHDSKCQPSQLLDIQAKLKHIKRDNVALCQDVAFLVDRLNCLKPLKTTSIEKLISSLSFTETAKLLEDVSLGMYRQKFIDEEVDGYLLTDCDRDLLIDLGFRPAHACKFLAILKGKAPHLTMATWKGLVGKRFT